MHYTAFDCFKINSLNLGNSLSNFFYLKKMLLIAASQVNIGILCNCYSSLPNLKVACPLISPILIPDILKLHSFHCRRLQLLLLPQLKHPLHARVTFPETLKLRATK